MWNEGSRLVRRHTAVAPGAQTERRAAPYTAPFSFPWRGQGLSSCSLRFAPGVNESPGYLMADLPLAVRVLGAGVFLPD